MSIYCKMGNLLLPKSLAINRTGYHDTQDTMANTNLDYGATVAAIATETVARVATSREIQ
jgi:hypothetical protein